MLRPIFFTSFSLSFLGACSASTTPAPPAPAASSPPPPAATQPPPPMAAPPAPVDFRLDGAAVAANEVRADVVSDAQCPRRLRLYAQLAGASPYDDRSVFVTVCSSTLPPTRIAPLETEAPYPSPEPFIGSWVFYRYHAVNTTTESSSLAAGSGITVTDDGTNGAFAGHVEGTLQLDGKRTPFELSFTHAIH
jgi:hypothetical protein